MAQLSTCFDKHQVVFSSFLFALLRRDLALLVEICFISNEHDYDVVPSFCPNVLNPFFGIIKRFDIYSGVAATVSVLVSYSATPLLAQRMYVPVAGYLLDMSYTTTATLESRMYEGIRLRNRSWPAVSQSCSRTVRSSKYMVCLPD